MATKSERIMFFDVQAHVWVVDTMEIEQEEVNSEEGEDEHENKSKVL